MHYKNTFLLALLLAATSFGAFAGNPDRQGEAGAYELLINPWARSAGLHTMNTSFISGPEAMQLNVAGVARITKTEVVLSHTIYLDGADMRLNALGFGQKMGKNGALGISLTSVDFGDIPLTSVGVPEGSGATFSPSFFTIGVSYAHMFANKISVGFGIKSVNETITNVSARGFGMDAGVQYVTGAKDNFKFGIALRNIGTNMSFKGEGLSQAQTNPDATYDYNLTYYNRPAGFELPSQLNIGLSYDWILAKDYKLTGLGNFCSNAFSRDQVGLGLELAGSKLWAFRVAYKTEMGVSQGSPEATVDNGLAGGFSVAVPLKKNSDTRLALDYAYRTTSKWQGTHNLALRLDL